MLSHAVVSALLLWRAALGYTPTISGTPQTLGLVQDPTINRDSCGSSRYGDRSLWVCRDSQPYDSDGVPILPIWSSSASWTDFESDGTPVLQEIDSPAGNRIGLLMYGESDEQPFYTYPAGLCSDNTAGACADGTRYALWPDQPPLVISAASDDSVIAYAWVKQSHISSGLVSLDPDPPVILYRVDYSLSTTDSTELPKVTIVDEDFWTSDQFPYGTYGGVVKDDTAYLYGQNSAGNIGLAKVPIGSIEDKSAYQYYIDETWVGSNPGVNASGLNIPNVSAGGQGTFYYSDVWDLHVWIGQASNSIVPDFYITTCASPEGPWDTPTLFHSAPSGNTLFGGYSLQAHPSLHTNSTENAIYLSYTRPMINSDDVSFYTTPLIYLQWRES
ncbi:hypothetical protein SCUP234_07067 [Seiridium cupressi]